MICPADPSQMICFRICVSDNFFPECLKMSPTKKNSIIFINQLVPPAVYPKTIIGIFSTRFVVKPEGVSNVFSTFFY